MKRILLILYFVYCSLPFVFAQTIITIAGNGKGGYTQDGGMADTTELFDPINIAVDRVGNVYIADVLNRRVRKINVSGIISTLAGNGVEAYSGDGGQATSASLYSPWAVAIDTKGNVYIADETSNVIRRVDTSGVISRFAGDGSPFGFAGDGGDATAAEIRTPSGLAVDTSGNVYIADQGNNRIRKVNTLGIISTIAGNNDSTGYSGDGGLATDAKINVPTGVAVDVSGNIYFADANNQRIRKINTAGIINTVAGNGKQGYFGDGALAISAELNNPIYVAVDTDNNIYIADKDNYRIRKVNNAGIISTIAGNGVAGYFGDGGPSTSAEINTPYGISVDNHGSLYIADVDNDRVRKVDLVTGINEISETNKIVIYPNPSNGIFTFHLSVVNSKLSVEVYNMIGQSIYKKQINNSTTEIDISDQPAGIYMYRISTTKGEVVESGKLIIE